MQYKSRKLALVPAHLITTMPTLQTSQSYDPYAPRTHFEIRVNLLTVIILFLALMYLFLLLIRGLESALTAPPDPPVDPGSLPVTRVRRVHAVLAHQPALRQSQKQPRYDPSPHPLDVEAERAGPSRLQEQAPPPYAARDHPDRQDVLLTQDVRDYGATSDKEHKCSCPHSL